MIKVGEMLEVLIHESGKTQTQVATELGLPRQTINKYVRHDGDHIKMNLLQKILDNLGYELTLKKKSDQ